MNLLRLIRFLPKPEVYLMYGLSDDVPVIYLKLPLWSALSLATTIWWNLETHQPGLRIQLLMQVLGDVTVTKNLL